MTHYSWYSLPDFKHEQKLLICISPLDIPEIRPLDTFSQLYQTVIVETMTVTKILTSVFAIYSQVQ